MSIDNSYEDPNPEKENMDSPQEEFIGSEAQPSRDKSSAPAASAKTGSSTAEAQEEQVIVIPPTHEQSNPSFHVQSSVAKDFIRFLGDRGIEAFEPVSKIDKSGEDGRRIVEIDIESETPVNKLEALASEFLSATHSPENAK